MPRPPHDSWVQGNDSGEYTSPVDKFLIHTTEGSSIAGAVSAYRANNSWPHLTVDCQIGVDPHITGHLDLNVPARSLRNMLGGVQTNRDGVIQIEVVGSATKPGQIDWVFIGEKVLGPICRTMGIPIQSSVGWVSYPTSYGLKAAQRLTASQWTAYKGVLGHQHCPENDHGDPGAIPIELILDAANQDEEFHIVDERDKAIIRNIIRQEMYGDDGAHTKGFTPIIRNEVQAIIEEMLLTSGSVVRQEGRELAKLGTEDALEAIPPPPA